MQLEIGFVGVGARRAVRRSIVVKVDAAEKVAGGVGIADYVQVEIGQFGADPYISVGGDGHTGGETRVAGGKQHVGRETVILYRPGNDRPDLNAWLIAAVGHPAAHLKLPQRVAFFYRQFADSDLITIVFIGGQQRGLPTDLSLAQQGEKGKGQQADQVRSLLSHSFLRFMLKRCMETVR